MFRLHLATLERIETRQLQQRDRLVSNLRAFNRLIYVSIKPNSINNHAEWFYASKVAFALIEQSRNTSAEQHCPCVPASPCHIKAD